MKRLLLCLPLLFFTAAAAAEPAASGQFIVPLSDKAQIRAESFRPACARLRGAVILFPGYRRNSRAYRHNAEILAQKLCVALYVPHFPARDFPVADYQHGGRGLLAAAPLIAEVKRRTKALNGGRPLPLILIGHSAGAQYLDRLAAYAPLQPAPARYILISAGTYAEAANRAAPPYGFHTLPPAALRAYLNAPITVLVGSADIKGNAHLARGQAAQAQGANRLARAQNFFCRAGRQAAALRLKFGWNFTIIPDLGHSPRALLASPALLAAVQKALR